MGIREHKDNPIYTDLDNDPTQALSKFKAAEKQAEKKVEAIRAEKAAGLL